MIRRIFLFWRTNRSAAFAVLFAFPLFALTQEMPPGAEEARLYEGFGNYTRPVSSESQEAQQWFNQGMQMLYGFNHDEAIRSFQRAAVEDPEFGLAWWGVSYAHGLHINNPEMTEEQSRKGFLAAQEAQKHLKNASEIGRAHV